MTGYGTGGTFHGTGKYIKEHSPNTKIILAEPGSANLVGSGIKTERNADGSPASSHPAFKAHPIQGWTPDFIPLVLEKGLDQTLQDEMVDIPDGASVTMSQSLARNEGILTGIRYVDVVTCYIGCLTRILEQRANLILLPLLVSLCKVVGRRCGLL